MRWLAACTGLALVAGLLEELAAEAGAQLADFAGLFALVGLERTLSLADALFRLGLAGLRLLADFGLGCFGGDGTLAGRLAAWW